jgi:hypothetical protein
MQIQRAIISDQEVTFLIIAVPDSVLNDRTQAEQAVQFFQIRSPGVPIALITRSLNGTPTAYFGRSDLAKRLLQVPPTAIVWEDLSIQ